MKRAIAILILMFLSQVTSSQNKIVIATTTLNNHNYYPWITFLTEGQHISIDYEPEMEDSLFITKNAVASFAFRVVITTSEIYNSIIIEKINFGPEGSNARIGNIKELNINEFQDKLKIKGELAGFEFDKWINSSSFIIKRSDRNFSFSDIDKNFITVEEINSH